MPKKHQPNYTKQSYTHSTSTNTRAPAATGAGSSSSTVNERLNQLRREQAPKATVEDRNAVASIVTQRTVPPTLRSVLNIPETAPPIPRPGLRIRQPGRRVPGPAAPPSWLERSRHAPRNASASKATHRQFEDGVDIEAGFLKIVKWPAHNSLAHFALKQMAQDWTWYMEFEQNNLCTLPARYKSLLSSYIARYGPEEGITLTGLKRLFYVDSELTDGNGGDHVDTLDLSGQIGPLSLSELTRYIAEPPPEATKVAETWEEEETTIPKSLVRFPHLTRLSLAHPNQATASWSMLLKLSVHLNALTHLSLAYWPIPSTTPNSKTARIQGKYGRSVAYGGSNLYSVLDDDWYEAASVLKRLSLKTYSLMWLDIQGCVWVKALTWEAAPSSASRVRPSRNVEEGFGTFLEKVGPDWNGSWSQIQYVDATQGLQFSPELDMDARGVHADIRATRSSLGGKYCHVEPPSSVRELNY